MKTTLNYKYEENKILYTNNLFKWIKYFSLQSDTIIISPMTKVSELLDLKKSSPLYLSLLAFQNEGIEKFLNVATIGEAVKQVNSELKSEVLTIDFSSDKVIKALFMLSEETIINARFLASYLKFLNSFLSKIHTVILVGFDDIKFDSVFNMLNVHILTSYLPNLVNWSNVESLVFLDYADLTEVTDRDKLKAYLELKTRTVLTLKDLEDFFMGKLTFNAFLIEAALRELK